MGWQNSSTGFCRKENYFTSFREEKKDLIKGNEPRGVFGSFMCLQTLISLSSFFVRKNEKSTIYEFYKGLRPSWTRAALTSSSSSLASIFARRREKSPSSRVWLKGGEQPVSSFCPLFMVIFLLTIFYPNLAWRVELPDLAWCWYDKVSTRTTSIQAFIYGTFLLNLPIYNNCAK
jgi:hypothetical protein